MKAFKTTITLGRVRPDNWFWMYSKRRPTWQVVQREMAGNVKRMNAKLLDTATDDYEFIAKHRNRILEFMAMLPKKGKIDELRETDDDPRIRIDEINIV